MKIQPKQTCLLLLVLSVTLAGLGFLIIRRAVTPSDELTLRIGPPNAYQGIRFQILVPKGWEEDPNESNPWAATYRPSRPLPWMPVKWGRLLGLRPEIARLRVSYAMVGMTSYDALTEFARSMIEQTPNAPPVKYDPTYRLWVAGAFAVDRSRPDLWYAHYVRSDKRLFDATEERIRKSLRFAP